jgi:hypothetical protein
MVNAAAAADNPSIDAEDVAVTTCVEATAPTASTTTTATAKAKPKAKVKKEMTAVEREVQIQKRHAWWVSQRTRKTDAMTATLEEERRE